jgi:hypothetical protein
MRIESIRIGLIEWDSAWCGIRECGAFAAALLPIARKSIKIASERPRSTCQ